MHAHARTHARTHAHTHTHTLAHTHMHTPPVLKYCRQVMHSKYNFILSVDLLEEIWSALSFHMHRSGGMLTVVCSVVDCVVLEHVLSVKTVG